jgi:uncharacterized protein (UPF0128 family)
MYAKLNFAFEKTETSVIVLTSINSKIINQQTFDIGLGADIIVTRSVNEIDRLLKKNNLPIHITKKSMDAAKSELRRLLTKPDKLQLTDINSHLKHIYDELDIVLELLSSNFNITEKPRPEVSRKMIQTIKTIEKMVIIGRGIEKIFSSEVKVGNLNITNVGMINGIVDILCDSKKIYEILIGTLKKYNIPCINKYH